MPQSSNPRGAEPFGRRALGVSIWFQAMVGQWSGEGRARVGRGSCQGRATVAVKNRFLYTLSESGDSPLPPRSPAHAYDQ
eukprot:11200311-Lingulodinium_polyedra.AAC.1